MKKKNILLILTDDQRHDTVGALGNDRVRTPHLDALVARGCALERCHIMGGSNPAVCMPSRAMLHTGRGLFELENKGKRIPPDHRLLGEYLRAQGYTCSGTGKWHNGRESFHRSFEGGGTIFFGGMSDHWQVPCHDFDPAGLYEGEGHIRKGVHSTTRITQQAVDLLRQHDRDRPFFCSVSYLAPHDPRTMPDEFLRHHLQDPPPLPENAMEEHPFDHGDLAVRDELLADLPRRPDQIRRHIAEYYGMIDHLDHNIGRILAELDRLGLKDSTIVVVAGDNGLALGQHGLMGKQSCYDHSLRVPLILAGPEIPAGVRRQQLCYLYDLFPTLCEAIGVDIPESVTGRSLWSCITGDRPHRESLYCGYRDRIRALSRHDGWKLICSNGVDGIQREQLFYLPEDPAETENRAADSDCAGVLARMREELFAAQPLYQDTWIDHHHWHGVPA